MLAAGRFGFKRGACLCLFCYAASCAFTQQPDAFTALLGDGSVCHASPQRGGENVSCVAFEPFGSVAAAVGTSEGVKQETESLVLRAAWPAGPSRPDHMTEERGNVTRLVSDRSSCV